MASYYVRVSITYRQKGQPGEGNSVERTSSCIPEPYSFVLDRAADGFFIVYSGGRENLESNWGNFDLLGYSIVSKEPCGDTDTYDCINGACIKASEYETPGLYENISECEKACGTGCSGKCLSNEEWSKIKDLAKKLKDKNCK